jgi:hypothetical protein
MNRESNCRRPAGETGGDHCGGSRQPKHTCWPCTVERAADIALASGQHVIVPGPEPVVLVPDVLEAEFAANSMPGLPPGHALVRRDGRTVRLFRWPGAA